MEYSSAPILLSFVVVVVVVVVYKKSGSKAIKNSDVVGQMSHCCLLDLVEFKRNWSIGKSENI